MFTFDGKDFTGLLDVQNISWSIMPPQSIKDTDVGGIGKVFVQQSDDPQEIAVDVMLSEDLQHTYEQKIMEVAKHLRKKQPKKLVFEQYRDWYVMAIVTGGTSLETIVKHGTGTITFYCPDPAFYKRQDDEFTYTTKGPHTFSRAGNDDSFPLLKIKGDTTGGGHIKVTINDVSTEFKGSLSTGETLYLDSNSMTAYIENSSGNRRSAIDDLVRLTFPTAAPDNNQVEVSTTGGASFSELQIKCRSRSV